MGNIIAGVLIMIGLSWVSQAIAGAAEELVEKIDELITVLSTEDDPS